MIFYYKEKEYCLTDWTISHQGYHYWRRLVMSDGKPSTYDFIGYRIWKDKEYTLASSGLFVEIHKLYIMYDNTAGKPVRIDDNTLYPFKEKLDDFLLRVNKLKVFI